MVISITGSQMQLWALFWHIRTLTSQPIAVSGIGAARFLPVLVFSLVGGLIADRYDRRAVLFLTQSVMALTALALGLLTLWGVIRLWHIYLITAIQAVAVSFDTPARQSLVPNLVPGGDLANAFSMQSIGTDLGAVAGPALSGVVIAYMGQYYTYIFNAISFLAVIVALLMIGKIPQQVAAPVAGSRFSNWNAIREGIDFIRHQPVILSTMVLDFFATFFSSANTLLPFIARDVLKVGSVAYGWLSAAQSIGAILAATVISQKHLLRRQGPLMLAAVGIFGLATVLFGFSRFYALTMLALILVGASDAVSTIIRNTIRQLQTPDTYRGRMTGVNQIFFMGGPQLGEIESGLAAEALGPGLAIVAGGLGCLLAVGWIARRWPQIRRYDGSEPVVAGTTSN
ncbi:MAG: MFS transporter [Chloroflexi bacterium]|nr:MFS transporter [Chloroflexota bacterium]